MASIALNHCQELPFKVSSTVALGDASVGLLRKHDALSLAPQCPHSMLKDGSVYLQSHCGRQIWEDPWGVLAS